MNDLVERFTDSSHRRRKLGGVSGGNANDITGKLVWDAARGQLISQSLIVELCVRTAADVLRAAAKRAASCGDSYNSSHALHDIQLSGRQATGVAARLPDG